MPPQLLTSFFRLVAVFLVFSFMNTPTGYTEPQAHLGRLEKISLPPDNPYTSIDIRENNEAMDALMGHDEIEKSVRIQKIIEHPEGFNPAVLFLLSYVLFQKGRKDEAMFWFYAGQLRARYDANRCADESAKTAVRDLNAKIGPYINPYAFQDLEKLKQTVAKVLEWDRMTPYLYDQRWINLHGMGAILSALKGQDEFKTGLDEDMSVPESQWEEIHRKTQEEYLAGFKEALKILEERKFGI